jgi:hypothetical protein
VREPDLNVTPRTADFTCGILLSEVFAPEPVGPLLFVNHPPNCTLDSASVRFWSGRQSLGV